MTQATDIDPETPRARLRRYVDTDGATQVAARVGCTSATIYSLLAGSRPSLPVAIGIAREYGIPADAWVSR